MHINTLKALFLALLAFAFYSPSHAQAEVEQSIQLLTSELVGAVTLDVDEFGKWLGKANDVIKEELTDVTGPMELVSIVTLSRSEGIDIQLAADPPLKDGRRKELIKTLEGIPAPIIKHAPYSFALVSIVNGGLKEEANFSPPFFDPVERRIQSFKALDLKAKDQRIREWAREELAPIFAYYTSAVGTEFKGVLAVGKFMSDKKYLKQNVEQLTTQNPDYWRAVMEMSLGNQLIPYSKIVMHLVNGQYDPGRKNAVFPQFLFGQRDFGCADSR